MDKEKKIDPKVLDALMEYGMKAANAMEGDEPPLKHYEPEKKIDMKVLDALLDYGMEAANAIPGDEPKLERFRENKDRK